MTQSPSRLWGLDLLRAAAIVSVVLYHYPKAEHQLVFRAVSFLGWSGVDLFFVLSGFLIGSQFFAKFHTAGKGFLRTFYARRFFRTLPAYFVVLAIFALQEKLRGQDLGWVTKYIFFLQNFDDQHVFGQSWSLCIEEHFYLLFPFVALLLKDKGPKVVMSAFAAVFVFGICARWNIWLHHRPDLLVNIHEAFRIHHRKLFYPTHVRLDGILFGLGLAALKVFRRELWSRAVSRANLCLVSGLTILVATTFLYRDRFGGPTVVLGYPLLALGFSLLVVAVHGRTLLTKWTIPGVSWLAACSYSIYLTHFFAFPIVDIVFKQLNWIWETPESLALTLALTLLLGAVLYYAVERPFLRLRDRMQGYLSP